MREEIIGGKLKIYLGFCEYTNWTSRRTKVLDRKKNSDICKMTHKCMTFQRNFEKLGEKLITKPTAIIPYLPTYFLKKI